MDKHLDAEALSDYAEGLLDGPRRAAADAHLAGCAGCRRELAIAQAYFRELGGLEPAPAPADFLAKVRARLPQSASPWRRRWSGIAAAMRGIPMPIAVAVILGITAITVYLKQGGRDRDSVIPMSAPAVSDTALPSAPRPLVARPEASPKVGLEESVPPMSGPQPGPAAERKSLEAPSAAAPARLRRASPAYASGPVEDSRPDLKQTRMAEKRSRPARDETEPRPMAKAESAPAAPGGTAANGSGADRPDFASAPAEPDLPSRNAGEAAGAAPGGKEIPSSRAPSRHAAKAKARMAAGDAAADYDLAESPFGYVVSLRSAGDSAAVVSGLRAMGIRCETGAAGAGERAYLLKVPAGMLRGLAAYLSRYGSVVPQGERPAAQEDSVSVRLRLRLANP